MTERQQMHGTLTVGRTELAYDVRPSERARKKRIVVTPESIHVVLPRGHRIEDAHAFVREKRRWVYTKSRELQQKETQERSFRSGSRVRYRGRWLTLTVRVGEDDVASVRMRPRLTVTVPATVPDEEREGFVESLLMEFFFERLVADGEGLCRAFAAKVGVGVPRVAVVPMRRMWASCGKDGVVRLNPELIELPRSVLEYVIAHEVCHLVHRNHSDAFWRLVTSVMPDYRERQAWLGRYEVDWDL